MSGTSTAQPPTVPAPADHPRGRPSSAAGGAARIATDQNDPSAREYPESRFRLDAYTQGARGVRVTARLGPWLWGPHGEPSAGALGVLVDNAVGAEIFREHPREVFAVTSELSYDLVAPPPWSGPELQAEATLFGRDGAGGTAGCEVRDGSGRLVAVATGRCRWIPLPPVLRRHGGAPVPPVRLPAAHGSLLATLGIPAGPTRHGELGRLVLPPSPMFGNSGGAVHGGILFCLTDTVTDALAEPGQPERTTSLRMNYLRPADLSQPVTATAEAIHRGRSLVVYRVTTAGPSDRPYTIATVTRERTAGQPA
ncbi:conserved hypothetical protein [Frankia canadensis]|uniref:Acyl-CoA thioesterase-like N-terminal HotDog domain-containing protein n=1 Tax=Frankia canadensis TaxID=1836972 RepID=A0A2I2KKA5_9ACTN|nr:PaaI family thioesterase [Frankia canadensis]SNQ46098.1 conserved hypothetical protein [Frankia canadensis]SOU53388.1 conserved hypothetical protein [Frankia canadensis]